MRLILGIMYLTWEASIGILTEVSVDTSLDMPVVT